MTSVELPQTSGVDRPRAVVMIGGLKVAIWFCVAFFLGTSAFSSLIGVLHFEKYKHVKERGFATIGNITSMYMQQDGHGRKFYYVEYDYSTKENKDGIQTYIHGGDMISSFDYDSYRIGDSIPIVYDTEVTGRSFTNFRNSVFKNDPRQILTPIPFLMGIFLLFFLILPALIILPKYLRERQLLKWGLMTTATAVDEQEYNAGKAGRCSRIVYLFTDNYGLTIQGKRDLLPTPEKQDSVSRKLRSLIFEHTTIFFDPQNSAKSLVYPPVWVRLREPPN